MADTVEEYMMLPYVTEVVPEPCTDGSFCYRAYHPELPGCMSHGVTAEEAITNLAEAKRLYIETLLEKGQPVPKPRRNLETSTGVSDQEKRVWVIVDIPALTEEQKEIKTTLPEEVTPLVELSK